MKLTDYVLREALSQRFVSPHKENNIIRAKAWLTEHSKEVNIILEACEKEAQEKVREIFEEIEEYAKYVRQIKDDMFMITSTLELRVWWQALKQKYLEHK